MNKEQLVQSIAKEIGITQKIVDKVLTSFERTTINIVAEGGKISLVDFGRFDARSRKGRNGRNPMTGEPVAIPDTLVARFSAGKRFRDRVKSKQV